MPVDRGVIGGALIVSPVIPSSMSRSIQVANGWPTGPSAKIPTAAGGAKR